MKKLAVVLLAAVMLLSGTVLLSGPVDMQGGRHLQSMHNDAADPGILVLSDEANPDLPSEPVGVTISPAQGSMLVAWSAPSSSGLTSITEYRVFWGTSAGDRTGSASAGVSLSYTITGLAGGTTYYVSVAAINAEGQGPYSSEVSAATASTIGQPSAPTGLRIDSGPGYNHLAWSASAQDGGSPLTGYLVYRSTSPGSQALLADSGLGLSYNDTAVENGNTYYYVIRASNGYFESTATEEVQGTPNMPPVVPGSVVTAPGLRNVTITWTAPADGGNAIDGYLLEYGTSWDGLSHSALAGNVTSYTLYGLTDGTIYYLTLRAHNSAGFGERTTIFQERTFGPPGAPVIMSSIGLAYVNLTWSEPASDAPVTGYAVYRGTVAGDLSLYRTVNGTNYFNDTEVSSEVERFYAVAAISAVEEGDRSAEVSAAPASLPGVVTDLLAEAGPGAVTLTWGAPVDGSANITWYNVYRGAGTDPVELLGTVGGQVYRDTAAVPGTQYTYAVAAINAQGEGARNSTSVLALYPQPTPEDIRVERSGSDAIITWTMPDGNSTTSEVGGFAVYRAVAGGSMDLIGMVENENASSFTDDNAPTSSAIYRVAVLNGDSSISSVVSKTAELEGSESGMNVLLVLLPLGMCGAFLIILLLRRKHNMV